MSSRGVAQFLLLAYAAAVASFAWARLPLGLLALVTALPLVTIEVGFGDVERTLSSDKLALAVVGVIWLARRGTVPAAWRLTEPWVRWWAAFLLVVLASALSNRTSLEVTGLIKQVVLAAVFLMALDLFSTRPGLLGVVLPIAGLTAGVVALLAVVEYGLSAMGAWTPMYFKQGTMMDPFLVIGGGRLTEAGGSAMFGSTFAHRNFLAAYLILVLPLLIVLAVLAARRLQSAMLVGGGLAMIALAIARSMGAWLGLALGGFLGIGLAINRLPSRRAQLAVAGIGVLLGTIAAVAIAAKLMSGSAAAAASISVRRATYRIGFAGVAERPLLGFGEKGYTRVSPRLERQLFGDAFERVHGAGKAFPAHSSFLQVAVERGLLGLAAFVGLLASILTRGIRAVFHERDGPTRALLLGLVAGLIAFVVQAFTENLFDYSKTAALFWILAAALVSLSTSRGAERVEAAPPAPASASRA